MSPAQIAAEQIDWWQDQGMTVQLCLSALRRTFDRGRTWGDVFSALVCEARRMNSGDPA